MSQAAFPFAPRFLEERCNGCGICFHKCPVFEWPIERASADFKALIETGWSEAVERCTGCMACNILCPREANPHTRIMLAWQDRYKREGLPERARWVLPHQGAGMIARSLESLPGDERAIVAQWEQNARDFHGVDTAIYAGCNMMLQPRRLASPIFAEVPVFGALDLCCGEPLYRMGCWDAAREAARRVKGAFERMGLKRVMTPCLAGYHLFRYVYPEVLGVPLDVEVVSVLDWLNERIAQGALRLSPLGKRAALHDSCWPKASGAHFLDLTRALLAACGVETVEPKHCRETALCCGMAAAASRFALRDIASTALERLRELHKAGADFIVSDCAGCDWIFALAGLIPHARPAVPVYHLLDIIRMAAGEKVDDGSARRLARSMAKHSIALLASGCLTRKRFHLDPIEE
ncbi:MAG: (Fe-S)-binding protein [Candidatus Hydrogenedentes bacterium]|nr:(Fe-S)-binding protein [Candidatus Hydrogenedentota bacterium]